MVKQQTANYYGSMIDYIENEKIKTQKARGVKAVRAHENFAPGVKGTAGPTFILPYSEKQMHYGLDKDQEWFARPCPITPRHGFVESRQVNTLEEAKAVLAEAREQDPDAELLVMPKLRGKFSGIATNAGVSWGFGNDGVTSATGQTVTIPTPMTTPDNWRKVYEMTVQWTLDHMNAPLTGIPYIELVEDDDNVYAVQYRDGPAIPAEANYIPEPVKVKKILYTGGSLLEWEEKVKKYAGKEGVVVSSKGGALSSHYAVHAISLGIPVVTSHSIEVGETLKPSSRKVPQLSAEDYQKIGYFIDRWMEMGHPIPEREKQNSVIATACAGIHAMSGWSNERLLLSLRACSVVALMRYISAACLGELRHWWTAGPGGANGGSSPKTSGHKCFGIKDYSRGYIYQQVLDETSIRKIERCMDTCTDDFLTSGWRHSTSSDGRTRAYGYGGPKWAEAAAAGHRLAKAIQAFQAAPTKENWTQVTLAANIALHTVHNNGQTLTKWLDTNKLTRIATAPAYGLMNAFAAKVALGLIDPEKKQGE